MTFGTGLMTHDEIHSLFDNGLNDMKFVRENGVLLLSGLLAWCFALFVDMHVVRENTGVWHWSIPGYYLANLACLLLPCKGRMTKGSMDSPLAYVSFLAGVSITLVIIAQPYTVTSAIMLTVWYSQLPYLFKIRHVWWLFIAANGLFIVVILLYKNTAQMIMTNLSFIAFGLFAVSSSFLRVKNELQAKALEKSNFELLAAHNLLGVQSAEQERLKIARDLHDSIGQKLMGLSLNLEVARHKLPADLPDFLANTKAQVGDTLTDLRKIVTEMRHHQCLDIQQVLTDLIQQLPEVEFECSQFLPVHNADLSQQLVYCLQEGVSNGVRHGCATQFVLNAQEREQEIVIYLHDNGQFDGDTHSSSSLGGHGLIGMNERLAPFEGRCELQQNSQGGASLHLVFSKVDASEAL